MIEQAVSRRNNGADHRRKRIYRGAQIALGAVLVLGWVLGFTLLSVLWDSDRGAFWTGTLQLLLLGTPILALMGILQVLIGRIGGEFDYELSGDRFVAYRIANNRRRLYCSFDLKDVRFCKKYSDLDDQELALLKRALFACCNSDSPDLTLLQVGDLLSGRRRGPKAVLLEPDARLSEALYRTLHRNGTC